MSERLKPCPFCGGEARIDEECGRFVAHCLNPDCGWRDTEQEAINAWNTRAERECKYCESKDGTFDGARIMMSNHGWQRINYCPNCGAKVVE